MHLLQSLSETALGRALIAYFFDLPRWTLANILFTAALLPAYLALTGGYYAIGVMVTLPVVPVIAGMVNMAASQTLENAPRLKAMFAYPATLITVFAVWLGTVLLSMLLLVGMPIAIVFLIGFALFTLLLIGVFAIYLPSQLKVNGRLIWRNALVLAVSNPIIGLGMLFLGGIGLWAVWMSKGALIVVMPALWVLMVAFTIDDRIKVMQSVENGAA